VARLLARSDEANVVDHRWFEPVGGEVHGLANVEVVAAFTQVVLDPCRRLGHLRRPSGLEGTGYDSILHHGIAGGYDFLLPDDWNPSYASIRKLSIRATAEAQVCPRG
jgi:hypothetical protein